ncbi:MAG TPA: hypothetical protein VLT85_04425 [Terriglobales bacterium]|nr:hypothetical protein [Terriglobales bacterium]
MKVFRKAKTVRVAPIIAGAFAFVLLLPAVAQDYFPSDAILAVTASEDGKWVASAQGDGSLYLWDTQLGTGTQLACLPAAGALAFDPGDALLGVAIGPQLQVWDVGSRRRVLELRGEDGDILLIDWVGGGTQILTSGEEGTSIWDAATGRQLVHVRGYSSGPARVSPDGQVLATADESGAISLWNVATGKKIRTFRPHNTYITDLAFDPSGVLLASSGGDNSVAITDVATGRQRVALRGHTDEVLPIAFLSGDRLLSVGADKQVRVWDVPNGKAVSKWATPDFLGLSLTRNGQWLALRFMNGKLGLWRAADGHLQKVFTYRSQQPCASRERR